MNKGIEKKILNKRRYSMCIDVHIHISLDGVDSQGSRQRYKDGDYSQISKTFHEYKKQGIYAIRDGGDDLGLASLAREIAEKMGIIYKTPINSFYKKGYYGDFTGKPVIDIKDFKGQFDDLMVKKPDHGMATLFWTFFIRTGFQMLA